MKYSSSPRPVWITEMMLMFVLGFTLATALWVGAWFFYMSPAQAAAMDEQESDLAACRAAREQLQKQNTEIKAAKHALDEDLQDAKLGWGRCIREKKDSATPPVGAENRAAN